MADEFQVITDAVVDEAKKWHELSGKLAPIKTAADGMTLHESSFYIGDGLNFLVYSQSYDAFQQFMSTVLAGGVIEFDQLGDALNKIAEAYDRADAIIALDLNKIYSK